MPEVRTWLEWQIQRKNRSPMAFAIIGAHIGLLLWIDKYWLGNNIDSVFDIESDNTESGWAAWNTFLILTNPHVDFFRVLRKQYQFAVGKLVRLEPPARSQRGEGPLQRLAEHLVILYVRGELSRSEDRELFGQFIRESHSFLRIHAIRFAGNTLLREDDKLTEPYTTRFRSLWELYWPTFGADDVLHGDESAPYMPWFTCKCLPADWQLTNFDAYVRASLPSRRDDVFVMVRMIDMARLDPSRTLALLDTLVRQDDTGRFLGEREAMRGILSIAMRAGGNARHLAERLIDHLGRCGQVEYGELLQISVEAG